MMVVFSGLYVFRIYNKQNLNFHILIHTFKFTLDVWKITLNFDICIKKYSVGSIALRDLVSLWNLLYSFDWINCECNFSFNKFSLQNCHDREIKEPVLFFCAINYFSKTFKSHWDISGYAKTDLLPDQKIYPFKPIQTQLKCSNKNYSDWNMRR